MGDGGAIPARPGLAKRLIAIARGRADGHLADLVRGSAVAGVMKAIEAGAKFLFNVVIARQLGAAGAGLFFIAFTVVTIVATIGRFGFDRALLRDVAASSAQGDWGRLRDGARRGPALVLGIAAAATLATWLGAPALAEHVFGKPDLAPVLAWGSLAIVPFAMLVTYSEMLRGLKRMFECQLVIGSLWPLGACFALVVLPASLHSAALAMAGAMGFAAIVGFVLFRRRLAALPAASPTGNFATLARPAWPMFGVALIQILLTSLPLLVLGVHGSAAETGIFGAANRTSVLITVVLATVNAIAAPKIAALYRQGDRAGLDRTYRHAAMLMTLAAIPLVAAFLVAPAWILTLFGHDFAVGAVSLAIMALGQLVSALVGPVGNMQTMTDHADSARNINLMGLALAAVLCATLIPAHGMLGAAIATAVPVAGINLAGAVQIWRRLGIVPLPRLRARRRA